jgi:hypothetical protein
MSDLQPAIALWFPYLLQSPMWAGLIKTGLIKTNLIKTVAFDNADGA